MIKITNLSKKYRNDLVLNNINLNIKKGKTYGLVGENGAGKTTLINCITKVIKDYGGSIQCNFKENLLGFMPQDALLEEDTTPEKLLTFFYSLYDKNDKNLLKNVNNALKVAGCYEVKDKKIKTLSHGMKRRIMIAQAILHDPEFIILDEPTSGLDPKVIIEIRSLIKKLKNKGKTLFISSHNTRDIEEICDYLIFIDNGIIKKEEEMQNYRGNNLIKITLNGKLKESDISLLNKIKNIEKIKQDNNELLIFIKDKNSLNQTINNILKNDIEFINIRTGKEIDDIFK